MKTVQKILMLFTVVIALAGCTSLRTASDFDKKASFSNYRTFDFYDKGISRLKLNDLDKRRLLGAVETEMVAKGFTKSNKPDVLVNLVVVARETTDIYNYGPGWGMGWGWRSPYWGFGAQPMVNQYMECTIIIDLLDPNQKKLVWHGQGAGFDLDNYRNREERMQKGVSEILAQYPPKQ